MLLSVRAALASHLERLLVPITHRSVAGNPFPGAFAWVVSAATSVTILPGTDAVSIDRNAVPRLHGIGERCLRILAGSGTVCGAEAANPCNIMDIRARAGRSASPPPASPPRTLSQGCDMRQRTVLWNRKHEIGAFWMRCSMWPRAAVGSYLLILDTVFQQGPMSDGELDAVLAPNTDPERTLIRERLTRVDGGWIHERAHEERLHSLGVSKVRAKAGGKGGSVSASGRKPLKGKGLTEGSNCLTNAKQTASNPSLSLSISSSDSSEGFRKGDARGKPSLSGREKDRVRWDFGAEVWVGLDEGALGALRAEFPAVDIPATLASLADWCIQHPAKVKARKSTDAFIRACVRAHPIYLAGTRPTTFQPRAHETPADRRAASDAEFAARMERALGKAATPPPRASTTPNGLAGHPKPKAPQNAS